MAARSADMMTALLAMLSSDPAGGQADLVRDEYLAQDGEELSATSLVSVQPWEREMNLKLPGCVIELQEATVAQRLYGGGTRYTVDGAVHCLVLADKQKPKAIELANGLIDACLHLIEGASRGENASWIALLPEGPLYAEPFDGDILAGGGNRLLYAGQAKFKILFQ